MDAVAIVAHKFLTQPDDELVAHLNAQRTDTVLHVCHSFSDAPDRRSLYRLYRQGVLVEERRTRDYAGWPEPLVYLKEIAFTLKSIARLRAKWDLFVGMDGLCVLCGNLLRAAGRVSRTVYWAIDFVPKNRFASRVKNAIYGAVNRDGYRRSDEIWDLSPRMTQAREEFGGIRATDYRRNVVVPYGMWLERIPRVPHAECERGTLVFMGHLLEKQGVQLVIRAIPAIVERLPSFEFKIIGDGSFRRSLETLADETGVRARCRFLGKIDRIEDLEREVARAAVAVAPYIRALDTWTLYADPGKVKTYLACGVPVILTDVPWNARDIERAGCGKVIAEDQSQLVEAVVEMMEEATNQAMRDRAVEYARAFAWPEILRAALSEAERAS